MHQLIDNQMVFDIKMDTQRVLFSRAMERLIKTIEHYGMHPISSSTGSIKMCTHGAVIDVPKVSFLASRHNLNAVKETLRFMNLYHVGNYDWCILEGEREHVLTILDHRINEHYLLPTVLVPSFYSDAGTDLEIMRLQLREAIEPAFKRAC